MMASGVLNGLSRTENAIGYEIQLVDPLSSGFDTSGGGSVSFYGSLPPDFPTGSATDPRSRERVAEICEAYGKKFYYRASGGYEVCGENDNPAITLNVEDIINGTLKYRYGILNGDFANRIVVNGNAEITIVPQLETSTTTISGVTFRESFLGDRPISRVIESPDINSTETWQWNDATNVCTRHELTETYPAGERFGAAAKNKTTSVTTVAIHDAATLSAYTITQVDEHQEYGLDITGPQTAGYRLFTTQRATTEIHRENDGSGYKQVDVLETASNKYSGSMSRKMDVEDKDEQGNVTGSHKEYFVIQVGYFDFDELLPASRERTTYQKKNDRSYSVTQRWKPYLSASYLDPLSPLGGWLSVAINLVPNGTTYGTDEPEQPEMAERTRTISSTVQIIWEDASSIQQIGLFEKSYSLPVINVPSSVKTKEALDSWLVQRANEYLDRKKKKRAFLQDEVSATVILNNSILVGMSWDGYVINSVTHTWNQTTAETSFTGLKPSSQTIPLKTRQSFVGEMVGIMDGIGQRYDNIKDGSVVKPLSNTHALVLVDGKEYRVGNLGHGALFNSQYVPVYRASGGAPAIYK
jgi:hypothetical protein